MIFIFLQKFIVKLFLVVFAITQSSYASSDDIFGEAELGIANHQAGLPDGDIKQIDYAKKLIDYMYNFDQKLRKHVIQQQNNNQFELLIKKSNMFHTNEIKKILEVYGWINISKFGAEYDQKAWILVQHADADPFFQAGVLLLLQNLAKVGETNKKNYAYLYDRVAAKFHQIGMLQKYGTQVDIIDSELQLQPYQGDLKDIDKHRNQVGLEPLNVYFHKLRAIYSINSDHD